MLKKIIESIKYDENFNNMNQKSKFTENRREEKFLKGKTTFAHLVVKKACTWLLK